MSRLGRFPNGRALRLSRVLERAEAGCPAAGAGPPAVGRVGWLAG
jgi:hypothetical protein